MHLKGQYAEEAVWLEYRLGLILPVLSEKEVYAEHREINTSHKFYTAEGREWA